MLNKTEIRSPLTGTVLRKLRRPGEMVSEAQDMPIVSVGDLSVLRVRAEVNDADIARVEFSGKDRAAGKHWEDWVKAYNEKKAAGEKNIGILPEEL